MNPARECGVPLPATSLWKIAQVGTLTSPFRSSGCSWIELLRSLVTSGVIVPILYRLDLVEPIIIRGDDVWTFGHWDFLMRDYALFACNDEVTKVSPVCAVEPVFQLLIKR